MDKEKAIGVIIGLIIFFFFVSWYNALIDSARIMFLR